MPARRDTRSGRWRYRKVIQLPDGTKLRISGTPTKNTKQAAEEAERQHAERALDAFYKQQYLPPSHTKEVPTFADWFKGRFWREWVIGRKNKPSEQRSEGYVVRNRDGSPLGDSIAWHRMCRICRRAGLPERGWHRLRHTFGTHAAHFGVNPWRLMHWMGHKRLDETMRYVHLAEAHMRPLPEPIVAAGRDIPDPDRRVLAMLSSRGNPMATADRAEKEST